jgi:hypothetical protein
MKEYLDIGVGWKTKNGLYFKFKKPINFNSLTLVENIEKRGVMPDDVSRKNQKAMPDYFVSTFVYDFNDYEGEK